MVYEPVIMDEYVRKDFFVNLLVDALFQLQYDTASYISELSFKEPILMKYWQYWNTDLLAIISPVVEEVGRIYDGITMFVWMG